MHYEYFQLSNGIRLVHKQQKGNVAHLGVVIHAGSRDEEIYQQGLAHFIEHLVFKGTKKRSNHQVLSRLENVGADLNAYTTKEDTSIYASIQAGYYQRAAELLSDIVLNSTFSEKEIEKEKAVIIDEINAYKDNPAEWIHDVFDELMYVDHPLGRNILGTPSKLKKYTRKDILSFMEQCYIPSRIVISSIANISMIKAISIAEKYFSIMQEQPSADTRQPYDSYTPFHSARKYSRHQTHLIIGNMACHAHDPRRISMAMLTNIIGGPAMNSKLNLALREKNGIAYNVEANYQPYADSGLFSIYCGTDEALMDRAITIIQDELKKFRELKLSKIALHTAQRQLKGQLTVSLESHQNEMLAMGKNMLVYNKVDSVEEINRRIDNVTAADLFELANEVFAPDRMSTLIFTNSKTINE